MKRIDSDFDEFAGPRKTPHSRCDVNERVMNLRRRPTESVLFLQKHRIQSCRRHAENVRHGANAELMLDRSLRRRSSNNPTLGKCLVLVG